MHTSREPETETVQASDAGREWPRLLDRVRRQESRVIVEENGLPVAAIVSLEDLAELERIRAEREARFKIIDQIREAFADVPDEELAREVDRAFREARARQRPSGQ